LAFKVDIEDKKKEDEKKVHRLRPILKVGELAQRGEGIREGRNGRRQSYGRLKGGGGQVLSRDWYGSPGSIRGERNGGGENGPAQDPSAG